ncbi:hypothetical protein [Sphaerothrix gracilis]
MATPLAIYCLDSAATELFACDITTGKALLEPAIATETKFG